MLRRCFCRFAELRRVVASYTGAFYDLSAVAAKAQTCRMPIHINHPIALRHFDGGRGRKPLEIVVLEPEDGRHMALFSDGSIVAFGMTALAVDRFRDFISDCEIPNDDFGGISVRVFRESNYTYMAELEELGYEPPEDMQTSYVDEGSLNAIVLQSIEAKHKLPFMYCLAEIVQIEALNLMLLPVARQVESWQERVREKGTLPFSLRQARKTKAVLSHLAEQCSRIGARQQIFWDGQYNHLRHVFNSSYDYYEVFPQHQELKNRMASVTRTLEYLSEEIHAQANHRLEVVIIVLITLELGLAAKREIEYVIDPSKGAPEH